MNTEELIDACLSAVSSVANDDPLRYIHVQRMPDLGQILTDVFFAQNESFSDGSRSARGHAKGGYRRRFQSLLVSDLAALYRVR